MNKRDEYLDRAAICVRLAASASEPADKMALLHMSECWREMASRQGDDDKADRTEPSGRT